MKLERIDLANDVFGLDEVGMFFCGHYAALEDVVPDKPWLHRKYDAHTLEVMASLGNAEVLVCRHEGDIVAAALVLSGDFMIPALEDGAPDEEYAKYATTYVKEQNAHLIPWDGALDYADGEKVIECFAGQEEYVAALIGRIVEEAEETVYFEAHREDPIAAAVVEKCGWIRAEEYDEFPWQMWVSTGDDDDEDADAETEDDDE